MKPGPDKLPPMPSVSTGLPAMDEFLGEDCPGYPRGKITEIHGSGASNLLEVSVDAAQKRGERVLVLKGATRMTPLLEALHEYDLVVVEREQNDDQTLFSVSQAIFSDIGYGALVCLTGEKMPSNLLKFAAYVRLRAVEEAQGVKVDIVKTMAAPTQGSSIILGVT